jgi:endonuclease/exonuclease/phosphatase family metal-dependent hydrolase
VIRHLLILLALAHATALAEPLAIRVVAANLTSDRQQSYSPDNSNHSNPEGAGARILKALKPDVVLIQEFNTGVPARQWVNGTFGREFHFFREEGKQIPNGVISRFPIIRSGVWDDPVLDNREFAWALLGLPGKRELWVVSVHLHAKGADSRERQATALAEIIRRNVPAGALLVIGGDLNTRNPDERCFARLARVVALPAKAPDDGSGNSATNAPRNRPYDWVLAGVSLDRHAVPVVLAGRRFPHGLVFDSRRFEPLAEVPPVQRNDSGVPFMQHMAVVRDFRIP